MLLLVARCSVRYSGRLSATLGESLRLLIFKSDPSRSRRQRPRPIRWS